ncbi:thiamine-phosphate kinase [Leucobacter sp. M11]|uniref:thiamine-phosphate kinase n=1 Tax=Leucobacter sp. M11 TaxID=2993565 RepID=UPI002D8006B5|nr:thiamine-phosphate kinase [Leucobacter sp. M11]MEB4613286.1 thiamine-phosphate kinase [Leucobacter sp. M11]
MSEHALPGPRSSTAGAEAPLTVGELGEQGLLSRVLAELSAAASATVGPGDDAAVLTPSGDTVITSDAMVEGPDFRRAWHSGFELGWKLAATNLSDVASMGAAPSALTVTIATPDAMPVSYLTEIARGLDAACRTLAPGCGVVGGDLSRAEQLVIAVTALGNLEGRAPVLRSGARPGQLLAYAGELGLSGKGLSLLFSACSVDGVATADGLPELWQEHPDELAAQLAPSPPIPLGIVAAESGATAMMDVSDSLSLDAARMGRASGVTLALETSLLGEDPVSALTGGEDHGLLAVFPNRQSVPQGFRVIGTVLPRDTDLLVDGEAYAPRGWDPYAVGAERGGRELLDRRDAPASLT